MNVVDAPAVVITEGLMDAIGAGDRQQRIEPGGAIRRAIGVGKRPAVVSGDVEQVLVARIVGVSRDSSDRIGDTLDPTSAVVRNLQGLPGRVSQAGEQVSCV